MAQGDKSTRLATSEFAQHAATVSKNALIDLVFDLLTRMHGEDEMQGVRAATLFNEAFGPVAAVRGDRVPGTLKKHLYQVTHANGDSGTISAWDAEQARTQAEMRHGTVLNVELIR